MIKCADNIWRQGVDVSAVYRNGRIGGYGGILFPVFGVDGVCEGISDDLMGYEPFDLEKHRAETTYWDYSI